MKARLRAQLSDEAVDDPETELADGSLEDEPRTVRMTRRKVSSFFEESATDDETVQSEWSLPEGPVDEVPLVPRTPTPAPQRAAAKPAPVFRPPVPPAPISPPSVSASLSAGPRTPGLAPARTEEPNPWWPVFLAVVSGAGIGLFGAGFVLWMAL